MANNVPITTGSGTASVAAETISGVSYQQIEVYGGGGTSVMSVNPDGSLKASIIGTPTVFVAGSVAAISAAVANQSVSGAVQIAGASPSSIATVQRLDVQITGSSLGLVTQGAIHGLTTGGGGGYVEVKVDPSGALVTASSSVVTFQGGAVRTSIVSSTPSSVLVGASIFGQLPAGTAVLGSVAALQGTNPWIITGSIQGTLNTGNSSVQLLAGSAVIGSVATLQGTNPWIITGSVQTTITTGNSSVQLLTGSAVVGSVATLQGTNPWVIAGSVQAAVNGSVVGFQGGTWNQNINTRSSLVSGAPSVITGTSSVLVLAAAPSGQRNYVTQVLVTNAAAAGATVSLVEPGGSVIYTGYAAASGGGFSATFPSDSPLKQPTSVLALHALSSAQASILVSASGYTAA